MRPDVPASIKARLLNRARASGEEFELLLVRYVCERFLYRLGVSPVRDRLILKGAGLLTLWMNDPYRSTRDIDLLAFGPNDDTGVRNTVREICTAPCPEDGLRFDLGSLRVSPIREEEEYQGRRAVLQVFLGKAQIRLQIDFGFGDAVVPQPEESDYPVLLDDLPAPRLKTYSIVTTVAEKFHAMVTLGRTNSRMKDFLDIWALSSRFTFSGLDLRAAIAACFERRRTDWGEADPDVLGESFYADAILHQRWTSYRRGGAFLSPPPTEFKPVGERISQFLGPVHKAIKADEVFDAQWSPDGPWR